MPGGSAPGPRHPGQVLYVAVAATTTTASGCASIRHRWLPEPAPTGSLLARRQRCKTGDERSCIGLGYAANASGADDEARGFYEKACRLGAANGCTNYAATVWAGKSTDSELTCARRTFERACTAKEPFACGMVGRIMIESTTPPAYANGRRYLSAACDELGGFSCRVLARHLESGKLGDYPPEQVPTLLKRACATGDPDACGNHTTAEETFK